MCSRTCALTRVRSNWGRGSKMDGAMDAEVSGEELQRALYSVDEEIICGMRESKPNNV